MDGPPTVTRFCAVSEGPAEARELLVNRGSNRGVARLEGLGEARSGVEEARAAALGVPLRFTGPHANGASITEQLRRRMDELR